MYGLQPEIVNTLKKHFVVKSTITPKKININEANANQISQLLYINYQLATNIIEYRTLHEQYTSLTELKKVAGFPVEKFDRIKLYLCIENLNEKNE